MGFGGGTRVQPWPDELCTERQATAKNNDEADILLYLNSINGIIYIDDLLFDYN